MATYSDDFEAGDTYPSNDIGANWTIFDGNLSIFQGQVVGNSIGFALYSAGTFAADQYSEVTLSFSAGGQTALVRAAGGDYYYGIIQTGVSTYSITKVVGGSSTTLASGSGTAAVGDVLRLEISGSAITLKNNGSTIDSVSDSSLTSGKAGLGSTDPGFRIDVWGGGDFSTFTPSAAFLKPNVLRPRIFAPGVAR